MFQSEFKFDRAMLGVMGLALFVGCSSGAPAFSESSASPQPGQHQAVPTEGESGDHGPENGAVIAGEHNVSRGSVHWEYSGMAGPANWSGLSSEFATCGNGLRQSPIDLNSARDHDIQPLDLTYRSSNLGIVNNGHTVQVNHFGNSFVKIDRWPYRLRQFHFHAPSEHTVEGRHYAMEMHLVHIGEWGRLAVVGVMIQEGPHNPAFDGIWDHLPEEKGPSELYANAFVDAAALLPDDRSFYHYSGSLTTPPCSENVSWYVLGQPITMSAEQIGRFTAIVNRNNRPVQPLNGRRVYSGR